MQRSILAFIQPCRTMATTRKVSSRFTVKTTKFSKYQPVQYDKYTFAKRGVLKEMDDRDRWLAKQYTEIIRSNAVVFMHPLNLQVNDLGEFRRSLKQHHIHTQFVNSRLFRGQLMDTRYASVEPLFAGPTIVSWFNGAPERIPNEDELALTDRQTEWVSNRRMDVDPNRPLDTISFAQHITAALRKEKKKLILLGAKVEDVLMDASQFEEYAQLSPMNQLYGQMIGLLQMPARQTIAVCQHSSAKLHRVLMAREGQFQSEL